MVRVFRLLKSFNVNTLILSFVALMLTLHLYIKLEEINQLSLVQSCQNEPIDVVYTWVNGSDPRFLREIKKYLPFKNDNVDFSQKRFEDKNELRFSLRSLEKYAPWVNHIYLVTNGQIPFWLNLDYEKLTVITHEQIFKDKHNLPSFSSPAIESNLHRIPGLSNRFIYFNDDIFIGMPLYPEDFYISNKGYLIYLAWTIPGCTSHCSWLHVGDGQCDKACNIDQCQFDGGDCLENEDDYVRKTKKNSQDIVELNLKVKNVFKTSGQNMSSVIRKMPIYVNKSSFIDSIDSNDNKTDNVFQNHSNNNRYNHKLIVEKQNLNISLSKIVEAHNRKILIQNKKLSKKKWRMFKGKDSVFNSFSPQQQNLDGYFESLQYTQKLLNKNYGFKVRKVPAHAPILIEKDIMQRLQNKFPIEFEITERNKFRRSNDVQFGFSYYYFLMSETSTRFATDIFNEFDTDSSGSWSDREIRNLLTKIYELPLSYEIVDHFEGILLNCSELKKYPEVPTPPYERYIDSKLPTITNDMVTQCPFLSEFLERKFGTFSTYHYNVINHPEKGYVSFKMLVSNITHVVIQLDEIRSKMTKFVCLNDNLDESKTDENELIRALLYDFYLSLFPHPSKFELPEDSRNRFLYMDELNEWKQHHYFVKIVLGLSIMFLVFMSLCGTFKRVFCKIFNELFC